MRVLIGVDGSPDSFAAVEFASRLLSLEKDELALYYSPPPVYVREVPDSRATVGAVQGYLANAIFVKARQHSPMQLLNKAKTIVGTHEPRSGMLLAADDCRADLIAIGARGIGPLTSSIGTVARHIVHHATIPVLVVRAAVGSTAAPVRVLLATDGSEVSKHAAEILRSLTWPPGSLGRIITVIEPSAHGRVPGWLGEQLDDEQLAALGMGRFKRDEKDEARIRQEVMHWCGTLPSMFECSETLVALGHAGEEILEAADLNQINLIVIGARKKGPVRRVLLGSTSEEVLTHASCSVLIVPEHERP